MTHPIEIWATFACADCEDTDFREIHVHSARAFEEGGWRAIIPSHWDMIDGDLLCAECAEQRWWVTSAWGTVAVGMPRWASS